MAGGRSRAATVLPTAPPTSTTPRHGASVPIRGFPAPLPVLSTTFLCPAAELPWWPCPAFPLRQAPVVATALPAQRSISNLEPIPASYTLCVTCSARRALNPPPPTLRLPLAKQAPASIARCRRTHLATRSDDALHTHHHRPTTNPAHGKCSHIRPLSIPPVLLTREPVTCPALPASAHYATRSTHTHHAGQAPPGSARIQPSCQLFPSPSTRLHLPLPAQAPAACGPLRCLFTQHYLVSPGTRDPLPCLRPIASDQAKSVTVTGTHTGTSPCN